MIEKIKRRKGGLTTQNLVLIVVGVAVVAVTIMTLKGGIESAYMEALENAMYNH